VVAGQSVSESERIMCILYGYLDWFILWALVTLLGPDTDIAAINVRIFLCARASLIKVAYRNGTFSCATLLGDLQFSSRNMIMIISLCRRASERMQRRWSVVYRLYRLETCRETIKVYLVHDYCVLSRANFSLL
jgi:hypothetical protein